MGKYHHGDAVVKDAWVALEQRFARILLDAVAAIKDTTVRAEVQRALEAGDIEGAVDAIRWEAGDASLGAAAPQAIRTAVEVAGAEAATNLTANVSATTAIGFDIVNPEAVAFVREHGAELIREFGSSSRDAIRELVRRTVAAEERLPSGAIAASPGRLARQIVDSGIGLLDRQLGALERFRLGLEERTALTGAQIDARAARKAAQMLRTRAKLIARTEVMRAAREGNQELWRQALAAGYLDRNSVQVWHTEPGACDECEPLEGATAPIDGDFPDPGEDGPPLHPACRCTLTARP